MLRSFRESLQKIVPIVKADQSIRTIGGPSWLNATNTYGSMKERLGFEISDTDPEILARHFKDEKRAVKDAIMTRERFLELYDSGE